MKRGAANLKRRPPWHLICYVAVVILLFLILLSRSGKHIKQAGEFLGHKRYQQAGLNSNLPRIKNNSSSKNNEKIYIFVAADESMEIKNRLQIESMRCYAASNNYEFLLGNLDESEACKKHQNFYYKRHCALASLMTTLVENAIVFLFDSDVVVGFQDVSLNHWLIRREDAAFYEREFNGEITAGSYQIRNNVNGRNFLKMWADFEFTKPEGFHSSDNGAIHIALLKQFNLGSECINEYNQLTANVTNLVPYFHVVYCARQALGMGGFEDEFGLGLPKFQNDNIQFRKHGVSFRSDSFSVKIFPRDHAWMHDWIFGDRGSPLQMRLHLAKESQKSIAAIPVFYHGIKQDKKHLVFDYWEKEIWKTETGGNETSYRIFPICVNRQGKVLSNSATQPFNSN